MQLTIWTYEGPPHVGAMRVATGMRGLHYVLHAPQGDTYADLLFTMIERRDRRPPVTYTTFQARDLGSDTADLFKTACMRHNPTELGRPLGSGVAHDAHYARSSIDQLASRVMICSICDLAQQPCRVLHKLCSGIH